ncbi:BamA/TamA family outer membrane protein [Zunongwangia sp.]|uniref:translocation and assembly module lipoprotein TamL n=1 Tax=Zunongwangia sp. TaxID=1965325 RepID=UPI003AA95F64
MKRLFAKISLFFLPILVLYSCNTVKRLDGDDLLLKKNNIVINGETSTNSSVYNLLEQKPNTRFLGFPFRLHFYNLARPNIDSILSKKYVEDTVKQKRLIRKLSKKQFDKYIESRKNFNKWIKKTGEAPAIVNKNKIEESKAELESYYWNNGWFNVKTTSKITELDKEKRAQVTYTIETGKPYQIDSIKTLIEAPVLDSIYKEHQENSFIKKRKQYKTLDFNAERERLTRLFRNNGIHNFEQELITFDADTIQTNHNVNTTLRIQDLQANEGNTDTLQTFKVQHISRVNIITDYEFANKNAPLLDSAQVGNYYLYSYDKLAFKPEAITDAIFIRPDKKYRDIDRNRTYSRLNSYQVFKYPNIQYMPDPADTTDTKLITNIFLTPQKKYSLGFDFDLSQSNIQKFGIGFGGSFLIRNIFRRAENLQISARGSIGSSKDAVSNKNQDQFFDITEIGADISLTLPRIFFPLNTDKVIPKYMAPFTAISFGVSTQKNIGLDKQNLTGKFSYKWNPSKNLTNSFELLDIQYVRNLNTDNYFNVYRSSYNDLNEIANQETVTTNSAYFNTNGNLSIPNGIESFIADIRNNNTTTTGLTSGETNIVRNIDERKLRLTENNLIYASSYTYLWNTKENLYDQEFTRFRFKIEAAGNFLSAVSKISGLNKNNNGNYEILGVNFSQYIKPEIDFIKHWDLGHDNILAFRSFGGVAIPYENANSIPFTRSFFAGGPNDNRAWQAYDLGPGSSGGRNEFNEANMKLAFNLEHRYNLFGSLNSAFFIDAGNIWNVLDIVEDDASTFTSLSDLKEIAIGSGFGLRYDFNFFILRFDIGFKTYNPARTLGNRWFKEYNFAHAVYNVGINYPF